MYRYGLGIVGLLILVINSSLSWADDFVPEGENDFAVSADTFILDADNTGGDVSLQFGGLLNETFTWDSVNADFSLSDSLNLTGNEIKQFNLENLGAAPTCDGLSTGRIYHNVSDSNSYICDGSTWEQIDFLPTTQADLAAARYRDSSATDLNAALTDNLVPWNLEDFEDASVYVHDLVTNNSRIQVLTTGRYHISGALSVENSTTNNFRYNGRVKIRINGTTVLPMRFQPGYIRQTSGQTETSLVFSSVIELNANDYFEILVDRENTEAGPATMIPGQSSLSVVQLKAPAGPAGPTGPTGLPGAPGDLTWTGPWVSQNYTVNQVVSFNGSSYVCILDTISNEDPTNPTYWDLVAEAGASGVNGTDDFNFTLDQDNFGPGADVTITAEQGTDNNGVLRYNATSNVWELNNDGGGFETIATGQTSIAQAYQAGTTTFNALTPIAWDGSSAAFRFIDSGFSHSVVTNSSQISVSNTGLYKVSYNITWDTTANARRTASCRFTVNGFSVIPAVGSSHSYSRNSTDNWESNNASFFYDFTAGDFYEIQCESTGSTGSITTLANESSTSIEFIR